MLMFDACRLQNKLRLFKLLTLQDGYAYLPTDDYVAIIARIAQLQQVTIYYLHFGVSLYHLLRSKAVPKP